MIALLAFKTCPSVDMLLGRLRLFMWLTSSTTLFMNSLMLSLHPGIREKAIFILDVRTSPLSVNSKSSSAWWDGLSSCCDDVVAVVVVDSELRVNV